MNRTMAACAMAASLRLLTTRGDFPQPPEGERKRILVLCTVVRAAAAGTASRRVQGRFHFSRLRVQHSIPEQFRFSNRRSRIRERLDTWDVLQWKHQSLRKG